MTRYIKSAFPLIQQIRAPHAMSIEGPICSICEKLLDSEELVEETHEHVKVLGKHHGAEQLVTFEKGTRYWDYEDLKRCMRGFRWFAPEVS